jgi:hypothetical protein
MWRCPACRQLNFAGQSTCKCGFAYGAAPPKQPARFSPPPAFSSATPERHGLLPQADTSGVRDTSPLLSIWLEPRATMRHIINTDPTLYIAWLLTLAAFFNSLDRASARTMGDRVPMSWIVGFSLLFSPLAVPLSHLVAMIGRWSGAKLGGVATRAEVRSAVAWASVPVIAAGIIFWPIQFLLFGGDVFRTETPLIDDSPWLALAVSIPALVLAVWAVFTGAKTFGEAHQFSAWRSIGAGMLVMAIIVVPLLALFFAAVFVPRML